jgi:hypothetical protein
MQYGLYLDFDNLVGGFEANLYIKGKVYTPFQRKFIPLLLKKFLQSLQINDKYPRFKKAFGEYHNLPFKELLNSVKKNYFVFLNDIGITPLNPFVVSSSKKNKNAADICLTLEVVNDLILKNIPLDAIVIFSGDIDFYPLISWVLAHTNKKIFLISFTDRLNKKYYNIFSHLIGLEYLIPAEFYLVTALDKSFHEILDNKDSYHDIVNLFNTSEANWLDNVIIKFNKFSIPYNKELNKIFEENLNKLKLSYEQFKNSFLKESSTNYENSLKEGLLNILNKYLKEEKKPFVSSGLIIKNLQTIADEKQLNSFFKKIIEENFLKEAGYEISEIKFDKDRVFFKITLK